MNSPNPLFLLVEDCPDDVFFMRYALTKAGISHPLHVATDGQQALDYLMGVEQYADRSAFPLPTAVLLDLKLPCLSGFDVLAWIRSQPEFSQLPVFIFTGSSEERDRQKARELRANAYFVKPPTAGMLQQVMNSLESATAPANL